MDKVLCAGLAKDGGATDPSAVHQKGSASDFRLFSFALAGDRGATDPSAVHPLSHFRTGALSRRLTGASLLSSRDMDKVLCAVLAKDGGATDPERGAPTPSDVRLFLFRVLRETGAPPTQSAVHQLRLISALTEPFHEG